MPGRQCKHKSLALFSLIRCSVYQKPAACLSDMDKDSALAFPVGSLVFLFIVTLGILFAKLFHPSKRKTMMTNGCFHDLQ